MIDIRNRLLNPSPISVHGDDERLAQARAESLDDTAWRFDNALSPNDAVEAVAKPLEGATHERNPSPWKLDCSRRCDIDSEALVNPPPSSNRDGLGCKK